MNIKTKEKEKRQKPKKWQRLQILQTITIFVSLEKRFRIRPGVTVIFCQARETNFNYQLLMSHDILQTHD